MFNRFYGFISIGLIELGKFMESLNTLGEFCIFALQIIIGILTIIKLYKDVKSKKFKSIEKSENEVKKKYKFLSVLFEYLKSKK